MVPEFVRSVREVRPRAFLMENVPALFSPKFAEYLERTLFDPLRADYSIHVFELAAENFGVPQLRRRFFVAGFRSPTAAAEFRAPVPTHTAAHLRKGGKNQAVMWTDGLERCMGVREALGLPDIGVDGLAPTIRSTLTGPRHTTSILSSRAAWRVWESLGIWPNGVAKSREAARAFVPENGDFRLSVEDCALMQGFPESWQFHGPVYLSLGQIGNSVVPPVAYSVACSVADALASSSRTNARSRAA